MSPPASSEPGSSKTQPWPLWAQCHLPSGESVSRIVTQLSADGAMIWAMKPPPKGSALGVLIQPVGQAALERVEATVTEVHRDPADVARCGFTVAFAGVDDAMRGRLGEAGATASLSAAAFGRPSLPPGVERRQSPRVDTRMDAEIELASVKAAVRVINLSMSGALLDLAGSPLGAELRPGAELAITVLALAVPEAIDANARVARVVGGPEPTAVAIRFAGLDGLTERRIEGLMLYALVGSHAML